MELLGLDIQIGHLESIRFIQDSIIVNKDHIIIKDSVIIVDMKQMLKENKHQLRKARNQAAIMKIVSGACIVLALI